MQGSLDIPRFLGLALGDAIPDAMTRVDPIKKTMFDEHGRRGRKADDGTRTHDINLGKVALYH